MRKVGIHLLGNRINLLRLPPWKLFLNVFAFGIGDAEPYRPNRYAFLSCLSSSSTIGVRLIEDATRKQISADCIIHHENIDGLHDWNGDVECNYACVEVVEFGSGCMDFIYYFFIIIFFFHLAFKCPSHLILIALRNKQAVAAHA